VNRDNEKIAHLNARIRAMKSLLFSRRQYDDLLEQDDLGLFTEVLLASPYEVHMAEALARYRGADAIEEALTRAFVADFAKLQTLSDGCFETLADTFFQRWDLMAVKSLLRHRHQDQEAADGLEDLIPGPTLTGPLLHQLARSDSVEALVASLSVWDHDLCGAMTRELDGYAEGRELFRLEDALDKAYFARNIERFEGATDADSPALVGVLRTEVDRVNLRLLFRMLHSERGTDEKLARLLPGGTLSARRLRDIAEAPGITEAVELLGPTRYRELVERLFQFLQTKRFSPLERVFDMFILTQLKRLARVQVLGIAVMMQYVWLKYNEVVNLRLIARGQARHLPRGRVGEELVFA
jgi:V/A-type H+/Na+-transporting ATPase subunit C